MKKLFTSLTLCLFTISFLQAQNPYASLGEEANVLTLSQGKYQEHFPNEAYIMIGGVKLNTATGKVEELLEPEEEENIGTTVSTRFLSLDPIAREYPELTPYQFASNMPIESIDLDGLERVSGNATFVFTLAGKKSYLSGSVSVGVSTEGNTGQLNVNTEARFYNGGLGFYKGNPGKGFMADLIISPSYSLNVFGKSQQAYKTIYTFTGQSSSNVSSNYKYSFTYGQNIIFNSKSRNQRSGAYHLSIGNFSAHIYNDHEYFGGDLQDRFYTGGGSVYYSYILNGNRGEIKVGNDVYTSEPVINKNLDSDYLAKDGREYATSFSRLNKNYNLGRSFISFKGSKPFRGESIEYEIGLSSTGGRFNMGVQDAIHDAKEFHRFPISLKDLTYQLNAMFSGSIDNSNEKK